MNVEATSDVSPRYSSVLVTVKEVWFNQSAKAAPADATWQKFVLDDPLTIDLVDTTSGVFTRIASELKVPPGNYQQVRVILASRDEDLYDSADDVDADYNNQVTWFDEDGDEDTVPLEILNAGQGIGIQMELEVKEESPDEETVQLVFDAARDLTEFRYSGQSGFLLNSTLQAFDPEEVGTIRGALNLSGLATGTGTGRPDIQVSAQRLDQALGRRVVVGSTFINRTGAFVLHPLPLGEDEESTEYDLVIHGPGIRTIILQEVPVTQGVPGNAAPLTLSGVAPESAESFEADIRSEEPVVPRGARIGFYQTLPGDDEPYLIDVAAVDPLRGGFAEPARLSRARTILHGRYGANLSLRLGTPEEGAERYSVAALSPHYGSGALAPDLLRPASQASDTALFSVPAIGMPPSAVQGTLSATLTIENAGRYDSGALLVTREGAVVTAVSLDEALRQLLGSTFIEVTPIPAGTGTASLAQGLYYLEAWTWNSADPEDTFTRHPGTDAVDLRSTPAASASVTIR